MNGSAERPGFESQMKPNVNLFFLDITVFLFNYSQFLVAVFDLWQQNYLIRFKKRWFGLYNIDPFQVLANHSTVRWDKRRKLQRKGLMLCLVSVLLKSMGRTHFREQADFFFPQMSALVNLLLVSKQNPNMIIGTLFVSLGENILAGEITRL